MARNNFAVGIGDGQNRIDGFNRAFQTTAMIGIDERIKSAEEPISDMDNIDAFKVTHKQTLQHPMKGITRYFGVGLCIVQNRVSSSSTVDHGHFAYF